MMLSFEINYYYTFNDEIRHITARFSLPKEGERRGSRS